MNIIYMHTHDTGRYISPYGYAMPTPNVMDLAKESVLFRHAFSAAPTCSPSRAALLTGMVPHSAGMTGLVHRGFSLNDSSKHLVPFLNKQGYHTVLSGVQHEAKRAADIGYEHVLKPEQVLKPDDALQTDRNEANVHRDVENAWAVAEYLRNNQSKEHTATNGNDYNDQPFFISFGMFNTHREFPKNDQQENNPHKTIDHYVQPPPYVHDNMQTRNDMARYVESVKIVDQCVGIVMDALQDTGQEENTIVIFTTDHGLAFPRMKCNLFDSGIGVSLLLKYPHNRRKGEAVDSLVSQIDLFPTLCDLLDVEKPAWLQGESMLPLLQKQTDTVRDELFAEVNYHAAYEPARCIRTDRFKYIRFFDTFDTYASSNVDNSPSKEFVAESGFFEQPRDHEMLFDLYVDPLEGNNLIHHVGYAEVYETLSRRLQDWMEETSDPLLDGKVPAPEGANVTPR